MKADPNSSLLTGVIIGKTKELGQGSYVRLLSIDAAASNKVYVTSNAPWFGGGAMNYVDQELISAKSEDIESVTVSSQDGVYTLRKKQDSQDIILDNLPAGKKLKSSDAKSVLTALSSLRFDDVKKLSSGMAFERQYMCRLKDSTVYALRIAQEDDKTFVSCVAEFTDKTPVEKASIDQGGEVESEEELKKKEAKLLARDNAAQFTTEHNGWVYEIAEWKAKNLTKELADLIEDEEKPEEDTTADPNAVIPDIISVPQVGDPNS
jgi:sulfur relay (sulfurtransferase) DsrF/TusC family protein